VARLANLLLQLLLVFDFDAVCSSSSDSERTFALCSYHYYQGHRSIFAQGNKPCMCHVMYSCVCIQVLRERFLLQNRYRSVSDTYEPWFWSGIGEHQDPSMG